MRRISREILISIGSLGLVSMLTFVSGEVPPAAHSALKILGNPEVALAQGTIPEPTATIDITEPITPTIVPAPTNTPVSVYRFDDLKLHAYNQDGTVLQGAPVEATIGTNTTQHTTDESGQVEVISHDNSITHLDIALVGPNGASSADASFQSTNPNFDTASISAGSPELTAELIIDYPETHAAQNSVAQSVITMISGKVDRRDKSLHIETSTGVAASVADFEANGNLTIDQIGEVDVGVQGANTAQGSEIIIFGSTADPDGFKVEIDTGKGLIAHTDIPAGMFKGGSLSINTGQITENTQAITVRLDTNNDGANDGQTTLETEVVQENPGDNPTKNRVLLPIAISE